MQTIKIDNKSYEFPTLFSDCKVSFAKKVLSVWDKQSEEFKKLIQEKTSEIEEGIYLNFLIEWCSVVTSASDDVIKRVHIIDLEMIWSLTQFILSVPETFLTIDNLKGVPITGNVKTLSGVNIIGGQATYEQWTLLNKINILIKESKEVKRLDLLKSMLTIIYPIKNEKQEHLQKRLDSYEDLNLLEIYSGWFFFAELLSGWKKAIQLSSKNHPDQVASGKVKVKIHQMQLYKDIENSIFGRFSPITWRKQMLWLLDLTK